MRNNLNLTVIRLNEEVRFINKDKVKLTDLLERLNEEKKKKK